MDDRERLALAEKIEKIFWRVPSIIGYYKGEKSLKENLENASR